MNGGYCIRSIRIVPSGCTAIDPTPLLFNNSHLEILDVLRYYQSLKTDTLAIRTHLINTWPASETVLSESTAFQKRRENAARSACLSRSNLLLPYL